MNKIASSMPKTAEKAWNMSQIYAFIGLNDRVFSSMTYTYTNSLIGSN